MVSHFGTIGLEIDNREGYASLLRRLHGLGEADDAGDGATRVVWHGRGGERVELEVGADGALRHVLPALLSRSRPTPVRRVRLGPEGVAHVELLDDDGDLICPLPVELTDRVELRALPEQPETATVRLGGLAESVTLHTDAAAYDASQDGQELRFATEHLVPVGLFTPGDAGEDWRPTAHARLAGAVVAVEHQVSELTDAPFHRLRVRTLGNVELDIAATPEQLGKPPHPGQWLEGQFFTTGTLGLDGPGATSGR